jgi:Cu2+-exporting ATPase/Cu+-exporting ATPase
MYYRLGAAIFLTINIMMFNMALYSEFFYPIEGAEKFHSLLRYLLLALSTPVLVLLGFPIFKISWQGFRARFINMDSLIVVGVAAAYGISVYATLTERGEIYFETMAMILILVTIGRYLEARAKVKASSAMNDLLARAPSECTIVVDGEERRVDARGVSIGSVLKIFPGDMFCVDGVVTSGESSVDESMLTGEPKPVFKSVGSKVFSGTVNYDGALFVRATEVGEGKVLSKLARLLDEARKSRAPIERVADRITAFALPLVVIIAVATFAYWTVADNWEKGLMNALSVLLISCPCALGIATPMALWISLGSAAKKGILIRRAEVLEQLARIRAVVFDKTGTLTEREMHVAQIFTHPNGVASTRKFLRIAASLESQSEHPLAQSLLRYAKQQAIEPAVVKSFCAYPGLGVSGVIATDAEAILGNEMLLSRMNVVLSDELQQKKREAENDGYTIICLGWRNGDGKKIQGLISLAEHIRGPALETIAALKQLGIHTSVLTGDNDGAGRTLSKNLNVEVKAGLLPEKKVDEVINIRSAVGAAMFVGDGINDAPAMNAADVGVAMGCGSDITREAADVNFLGNDLTNVPWLLHTARRTYHIIQLNLVWAFAYNIVGVGLAAAGLLNPIIAALAMTLSSTFVVRNSLRLSR